MTSQSRRDCSLAAGEVSSMYSTPKESSALAISIFFSVSKKAFANCSPSLCTCMHQRTVCEGDRIITKVDSMIAKSGTRNKKPSALGCPELVVDR